MEALTERVNVIIGDQLGVERANLVPEANLLDDLGADSLDVVELVMALEEEFGVEVPDEDVETMRRLRQLGLLLTVTPSEGRSGRATPRYRTPLPTASLIAPRCARAPSTRSSARWRRRSASST